ncbi:hypothetical protein [Streptomyces sp. NPDC026589]|uniref:hypothetical protein n=1 Tax=Streptomyces sp. NPDC026589 TaxID=3155609 RepID=UPI0033DD584F
MVDLLVPPLVQVIVEKHPDVDPRVSTAYSGHPQEWLDAGDLNLSLVYSTPCDSTAASPSA